MSRPGRYPTTNRGRLTRVGPIGVPQPKDALYSRHKQKLHVEEYEETDRRG